MRQIHKRIRELLQEYDYGPEELYRELVAEGTKGVTRKTVNFYLNPPMFCMDCRGTESQDDTI
jgi:hypothetical protein